jgi:AraC-like DNA-binding protein/ligand-binding sensor protein
MKGEAVIPAAKGVNVRKRDFAQELSRLRIYQDYEQAFQKATKLPLQLSPIDVPWRAQGIQSKFTNPFCTVLSQTRNNCGPCLQLQRKLTRANNSDTQTVRCFAGITNTSVPVKAEERIIAFLRTGQVLLQPPSAERFKKIANQLASWGIKINRARLEEAYFHSQVVSPTLYRAIVRLLEIFAEQLGMIANHLVLEQGSGDSLLTRRAKDYVARHQSDPIRLAEITRTLNVSAFHFCRTFKQTTGLTFGEYLRRVRIEKAKVLLHKNELRISEIAYEVGFQSITHFNRIFRKVVGQSPTEFRSRLATFQAGDFDAGASTFDLNPNFEIGL